MEENCIHCGGPKAIHHYQTEQCPVGGVEAPIGRRQEWKSTTFEADNSEDVRELLAAAKAARDYLRGKFWPRDEQFPYSVDHALSVAINKFKDKS